MGWDGIGFAEEGGSEAETGWGEGLCGDSCMGRTDSMDNIGSIRGMGSVGNTGSAWSMGSVELGERSRA